MNPSNETIDQLMSSDLQKKRDQGIALSYRQNTVALNNLSNAAFNIQRVIGTRIENLNTALDEHRIETIKSLDKLTAALKKADAAGQKVSDASNRLTIFLVVGTLVQAAVAVILLFKK